MKLPVRLKRNCRFSDSPALSSLTTVGVGGEAPCLLEPVDRAVLADLLSFLTDEKIPFRLIGAGSNILAGDGGVGVALVATGRMADLDLLDADGDGAFLRADAGVPLPRLVAFCSKQGLSGVECLTGIPGTVGGAVVKNAGGRQGDVAAALEKITGIDSRGSARSLDTAGCGFLYRHSDLREAAVVEAIFRLHRSSARAVRERTARIFEQKARSQPLEARSCGCVFKNPPGESAGKLLDEAGLKGTARGGASISRKHANFMINDGTATCRDFDFLIRTARDVVRARYGLDLELEIDRW